MEKLLSMTVGEFLGTLADSNGAFLDVVAKDDNDDPLWGLFVAGKPAEAARIAHAVKSTQKAIESETDEQFKTNTEAAKAWLRTNGG